MKILLIMDPAIPVPPILYGGHERLVAMFIEEYSRLGHEVTLLAGPNSKAPSLKVFGKNNSSLENHAIQRSLELLQAWTYIYKNWGQFDLIHNFGRLLYLLPILNAPVTKIMSYGREVTAKGIKLINKLPNKNLVFTACSSFCVNTGNVAGKWETVYNAVDFSLYDLTETVASDAPLMFLGRFDPMKGAHEAIRLATETNNRLIIAAAKPTLPNDIKYFNEKIKPKIDNDKIVYLGALNDKQKNEWLGKSKALIFPINGPEAFGLVMVEAMACGTPVIAYNCASVPEVVDDGITGFIAKDFNKLKDCLAQIDSINRERCRSHAKKRFDLPVIAKHYLSLSEKQ